MLSLWRPFVRLTTKWWRLQTYSLPWQNINLITGRNTHQRFIRNSNRRRCSSCDFYDFSVSRRAIWETCRPMPFCTLAIISGPISCKQSVEFPLWLSPAGAIAQWMRLMGGEAHPCWIPSCRSHFNNVWIKCTSNSGTRLRRSRPTVPKGDRSPFSILQRWEASRCLDFPSNPSLPLSTANLQRPALLTEGGKIDWNRIKLVYWRCYARYTSPWRK